MKKIFTVLLLMQLYYAELSPAQNNVGIGTNTPDASAKIDITSSNKGLLIPRIALISTTDATTIPSPATSLLIYNTATAGVSPNNVTSGFYYNSNTPASPTWTRLNTSNYSDTLGWTKALSTATKATKTDNQYVTGKIGVGDFSSTTPAANLQVIGTTIIGSNTNTATGINSFASGAGTNASGSRTFVTGENNLNAADNSIVAGYASRIESGYGHSIAVGYTDTLVASASAAFGFGNKVTGFTGFAAGDRNKVTGQTATSFGYQNNATGTNSFSIGQSNNATGNLSFVNGINNTAASYVETVLGLNGTTYTPSSTNTYNANDRLLNVGNGSSSGSRSDAFTILKNGNIGINNNTPNSSSILDINSSSKGIRLPNVALTSTTDASTITTPVTSLLIYNTAIAGVSPNNVTPGFYYNSNTSASPIWTRLNTNTIADTLGWTKALTTTTKATKADNQYVTGNIGVGNFSSISPSDKIHVKGNLRIDSGRIDFRNTGQSVFVGEGAGINDDLAARSNVAIGYNTLNQNSTGNNNVAIGTGALEKNTASLNTAVGRFALNNLTTGFTNAAFGESALRASTTGFDNTALGQNSLRFNSTGNRNTAVGNGAGYSNTGTENIFLGYQAGYNETGNNKLYIENSSSATPLIYGDFSTNQININGSQGINTLPNVSAVLDISSTNKGIRLPNIALTSTTDAATIATPATSLLIYNTATAGVSPNNVTPGYYYNSNTPGSPIWTRLNTITIADTLGWTKALTTNTKATIADNQYVTGNVGIGDFSVSNPSDKLHVKGNIKVDAGRIPFVNTGQSVFIGENAGMSDDLTNNINVFVGKDAGLSNTNGEANTFVGILSGRSNTTGNLNTAFGAAALDNNTIGASNVAVGRSALSANSTGNNNVAIGESALHDKTLGSDNVVIGFQALTSATNVANNVAVGKQAGYSNLNGNGNIFLGYTAGYNETGSDKLYIDNSNTATPLIYGDFASNHITINDSLTSKYFQMTNGAANGFVLRSDATGNATWINPTSLITDTVSWTKALTTSTKATTTDDQYVTGNIGVGDFSAAAPNDKVHVKGNLRIDSGRIDFRNTGQSVFVGEGAGINDDLAARSNVAIGYNSLNQNTTGNNNVAIGTGALEKNTASFNTAVGRYALKNVTTGFTNAAFGESTLRSSTTGFENTAFGQASLRFNITGNRNTVVGSAAGYNNTGSANIFFGYQAGFNETGNNKLYIENSSSATPLIYGDFASNHITINDSLTSKYFQMTNGAANGFVLRSDATGNATWTNPATLITDTSSWTKALTTNTTASKSDNQYVTGKVGIGDFSASTPNANIQVIGNGNIGTGNTISGSNALVTGNGNTLSGNYSIASGQFNNNAAENSIIAGYFSRIENGYGHSILVGYTDTIAASSAAVFGVGNKVTAYEGFAAGDKNKVSGQTAAAFGGSNNATASNAFVTGGRNTVSASNAFAAGNNNIANGNNSFVNGSDNTASSFSETTIGLYGTNYTPNSTTIYNATDRVLNVGNGVNSSARSDAFTILKNGNIGVNNSTPNSSAILDITATNKGVRLPNVALTSTTDAATIATPATSLLIYNTATAGISPNNITPGFYYNSNTSVSPIWTRLNTNNAEDTLGWTKALTSTTKATKTDNQYVTGNIGVGDFSSAAPNDKIHVKGNLRIDSGRIDFRNTGQSVFVGEGAGINDDLATRSNVAIGYNSLNQNITGNNNVAIGTGALEKNTASFNTAVGRNALNSVTTGYTNAAFGESTLRSSTTGFENTAFGQASLRFNITGNRNTVVGSAAGYNNTGSANIFFGYQAGFNETGNNKLYIENSSSATPLIYGDFASNHITINDSLTSKYFQMTNGAANGFVLRSDATGNATWTNPATLITDTSSWTKALTTNTTANKSDNQYVTGKVGIGDFSASTPNANIQVIGNGNIGTGNTISGTNSFVTGFNNTVTGTQAFSTGGGNNVSGNYSVALNNTNTTTSSATTSIVGGYQSYVSSNIGLAIGYNDTTTAQAAAAFGFDNNAAGANSFAAGGASNIASGANSLATGSNNSVTATQAFAAGGNNNAAGVNSFVAGGTNNNVSGNNSFVTGFNNTVTGTQAFAAGGGNNVAGNYSVALNNTNTTTNTATTSLVGGYQSYVTSNIGLAIGQNDTTTGQAAAAFGFDNNAAGVNSFVAGTDNLAASYSETALGINGTRYTAASATTYNATDRIFNVGNGASASNRADAFTILKNGNIGVNNNTPNSSAILDISSINKGVRLPNVPLTSAVDAATITAPALSLLIYNTEFDGVAPNNVVPGYYYNSGTPASPKWSRFVTSTDSIGWIKALSSSTKAIKTDNQYVTGNIGIGDFSAITPSNNISFTQGANKTIGAERSTTAGTYYNLTVQAGGAMAGQNNNHGGDLILSGGTATGNGGSVSDLGSNVIFKTATPLGSSSNADQIPTEKVRIKGDGTVNVATMAGTGNRTVIVDANGNLSASKNMVYVEDRAERTTDATNSGFRSIGSSTGNLAVNTGDVIAISLTLKFKWTGGTGTDQARFGINITGCTSATVTDTYEKEDADDVNRNQYQPFSAQYIYTATCNGNLQFNLLMDSNSNADDNAKTGDVVIVARKL